MGLGSASLRRKGTKVVPILTEYARSGGGIQQVAGAHLGARLIYR
jgi:hypothetical protein